MTAFCGLGEWKGSAEVYGGDGRFLGNGVDQRHVRTSLGDNRIRIDLPSYAGQKGYQTAASADIGRISKMVLAELKAQGIDTSGITGVTVTYGKRKAKDKFATEGETISL